LKEIPPMEKIKSLAEDIQAIKISAAQSSSTPAPDTPQLRAAMEEAKALSARLGPDSPEARVAWTEVEDIASSGLDNALGARLDDECLVESAMSACVALEELSRVVNLQRVKDEGMADF
jgi:CP12 domain